MQPFCPLEQLHSKKTTNLSIIPKITIPKSPSMKYIINKEHYNEIQSAVFNLCETVGIEPIIYDYWSWNDTH